MLEHLTHYKITCNGLPSPIIIFKRPWWHKILLLPPPKLESVKAQVSYKWEGQEFWSTPADVIWKETDKIITSISNEAEITPIIFENYQNLYPYPIPLVKNINRGKPFEGKVSVKITLIANTKVIKEIEI